MTSLLTSVIIVNYNCGPLLTECVRSVLSSTVPVEVFVSDNGSTDGSIELLNGKIKDDRLHVELNGRNLGFAKGTNMVLSLTTGEYILFLNPDCVVQPDIIEVMTNKMKHIKSFSWTYTAVVFSMSSFSKTVMTNLSIQCLIISGTDRMTSWF